MAFLCIVGLFDHGVDRVRHQTCRKAENLVLYWDMFGTQKIRDVMQYSHLMLSQVYFAIQGFGVPCH